MHGAVRGSEDTGDSNNLAEENSVQLILEQHGFELCGSTYLWILFNRYCKCVFSSL